MSLCLAFPSPAALPLPSLPAGPGRADCANEDWALPGCPPQGWAPHACLATSCANVVPPPTWGWGAASTYWLEETTAQPYPLLSGIMCPHLSVCLYSPRRSILPHIKPPSCPLRQPPKPALFPPHGCRPRHAGAADMQGDGRGRCRKKLCLELFTPQEMGLCFVAH